MQLAAWTWSVVTENCFAFSQPFPLLALALALARVFVHHPLPNSDGVVYSGRSEVVARGVRGQVGEGAGVAQKSYDAF